MKKPLLQIKDLKVSVDEKEIIKGLSFNIEAGKIYALMGPNGSGKSTLANAIAGHPQYRIGSGKILLRGRDITKLKADERAKKGVFLSFQYPKSIPGVTISNFLRAAYKAVKNKDVRVFTFKKILQKAMRELDIPEDFMDRYVNEGFSGGEKKKLEILQALILEPQLIIMDETDSGLDVDALKIVSRGVKKLLHPDSALLLITHYRRILDHLKPDQIYVMKDGLMVESGDARLARRIEKEGFKKISRETVKEPAEELVTLS